MANYSRPMTNNTEKDDRVEIADLRERQKYAECPECGGEFVLTKGQKDTDEPGYMWFCKSEECPAYGLGYETKRELYRSLIEQNPDYNG